MLRSPSGVDPVGAPVRSSSGPEPARRGGGNDSDVTAAEGRVVPRQGGDIGHPEGAGGTSPVGSARLHRHVGPHHEGQPPRSPTHFRAAPTLGRMPGTGLRTGVLGGTFDPPHIGHLLAALNVRHALGLDEVLLVVANDPWQKTAERPITPAADRLAMVEAAADGLDGLVASRPRAAPGRAQLHGRHPCRAGRTRSGRGAVPDPRGRRGRGARHLAPGRASCPPSRPSCWSTGRASRARRRPRAGRSSGWRSPGSSCRAPICANGSPTAARSTCSSPRRCGPASGSVACTVSAAHDDRDTDPSHPWRRRRRPRRALRTGRRAAGPHHGPVGRCGGGSATRVALVLLVLAIPALVFAGLRIILDSTDGQLVRRVTDPTAPGYEAVLEPTPTAARGGRRPRREARLDHDHVADLRRHRRDDERPGGHHRPAGHRRALAALHLRHLRRRGLHQQPRQPARPDLRRHPGDPGRRLGLAHRLRRPRSP